MGSKISFIVGLGAGYVLGTRAGRQRYDSIVRTAQKIKEHPTVQNTAGAIQAQAGGVMGSVRDRFTGSGGQRADSESQWWEEEKAASS